MKCAVVFNTKYSIPIKSNMNQPQNIRNNTDKYVFFALEIVNDKYRSLTKKKYISSKSHDTHKNWHLYMYNNPVIIEWS